MPSLQTKFAGLTLKNPLVAGSSGLTHSLNKIKDLEKAGVGAVVLKSLFEEQIESHSEKLSLSSDYPEAIDYINTYVKMNHVGNYLDLIRSAKAACNIPIIASINCYKLSRWTEFAKNIEAAGADAIELNIFLLNADEFPDNYPEEFHQNVVRELKKSIHIPLIVKMGKTIGNLPGLVKKLKALGTNGVVLFNRFYQPDIDIDKEEIVSGPVFSNPSDFSDTLRWTAIVSGKVPEFDIACSHGVHSWEDAIKGILAGTSAIQLCSMLYQKGPSIVGDVLTSMEKWMKQHHYENLSEFKGKLNYTNIASPALYERVQFMKYFSNFNQ